MACSCLQDYPKENPRKTMEKSMPRDVLGNTIKGSDIVNFAETEIISQSNCVVGNTPVFNSYIVADFSKS